jgi:hypothetical protein
MLIREGIRTASLLCCLLLLGCGPVPVRPNAKAVERDLANAVLIQSTTTEVLEYLSGKKIEYSQYVRDGAQGNLIRAAIREDRKSGLVTTECLIVFRFDDHDRFVSYTYASTIQGHKSRPLGG